MKIQPYPCYINCCQRWFINMDTQSRTWIECRKCGRSRLEYDPRREVALEGVDPSVVRTSGDN
jgi:hypothetical protein